MDSAAIPLTSEQQMNVFRLRDKMSLLNAEFLKVLKGFYSEKKHYDFSDTMRSYMKHVKELKTMYNVDQDAPASEPAQKKAAAAPAKAVVAPPTASVAPPPQRKIARAVRKNGPTSTNSPKPINSTIFAASSPANVPSIPKFGDISVIAKETPAPVSKLAEPAAAPAPATARKRAIRGGGPLGGSESVVFKNTDGEEVVKTTSNVQIPETTIKFPEPSKDFWTKPASSAASADSGAPKNTGSLFAFLNKDDKSKEPAKFSGFSFGKKPEESDPKPDKKEELPKVQLFGSAMSSSPSNVPAFPSTTTSSSSKIPLFGSITDSGPSKVTRFASPTSSGSSTVPLFGTTSNSPSKPSLFGSPTKPSLFGKPAEEKKDDAPAAKAPLTFGSSLFGNSSSAIPSTAGPTLTFGSGLPGLGSGGSLFSGLRQTAALNQAKADAAENNDDEGEYVPPKAETVEIVEPDAILSSKVSVFKFSGKEYTKLGIGMLHIKNTDEKHSLLIRAATTTGTVWLNALCNAAMKATKVDDKGERIRLTCPTSMTEMTTMMIRFGTAEGAKKFTDKIEELAK